MGDDNNNNSNRTTRERAQDKELLRQVAIELDDLRLQEQQQQQVVSATTGTTASLSSAFLSSSSSSLSSSQHEQGVPFPKACQQLLLQIRGNKRCVDCGRRNPDWCSVSYGVLLCVSCSGVHRSYGVQTSRVRSLYMDAWSSTNILKMLEGGNDQLKQFYKRHGMDNDGDIHRQNNGARACSGYSSGSSSGSSSSCSGSYASSSSDDDSSSDGTSTRMVNRRYHTKAARFYRQQLNAHVTKLEQHQLPMNGYQGREVSRQPQQRQQSNNNTVSESTPSSTAAAARRQQLRSVTPAPIQVQ